jgi:hypothetical protein
MLREDSLRCSQEFATCPGPEFSLLPCTLFFKIYFYYSPVYFLVSHAASFFDVFRLKSVHFPFHNIPHVSSSVIWGPLYYFVKSTNHEVFHYSVFYNLLLLSSFKVQFFSIAPCLQTLPLPLRREQRSKWKFRSAGVLLKIETRTCRQKNGNRYIDIIILILIKTKFHIRNIGH